jgi:hypothetical protein
VRKFQIKIGGGIIPDHFLGHKVQAANAWASDFVVKDPPVSGKLSGAWI